ncbi:helix-turn-helix transcriptional regulator [Gottschalkiaceae bacterium SANA]|nr:helix-turn-helix transcriptional regulator [Gottschalkiaceae bacterium SANA]
MILADKIIKLRKQFGWSQEALAERMNVSRQSVSKWESANSIPDLNKIIMLSEIFGVSTDYLLLDEIEETEALVGDNEPGLALMTLDDAAYYMNCKRENLRYLVKGVLLAVFSVVPLFILLALAEDKILDITTSTAAVIGLVSLLLIISLGVSLLIRTSQFTDIFERFEKNEFELAYGVRSIYKERLEAYKRTYFGRMSISITLFITSCVPLIITAFMSGSAMLLLLMIVVMMLMIGIGIALLLPASTIYNAYNCILGEGDYSSRNRKQLRKAEKLALFYWPLVTAVYIGWSLWTMAWGITWIIWPVAAIAYAAVLGLMGLFEKVE